MINNNQHLHSTITEVMDPKNPNYQLHADFPPNKDMTWTIKPEDDGWTLIHDCIRKEIRRLHQGLFTLIQRSQSSSSIPSWQVESMKYVFQIHFQTVHGHHTNEDQILIPVLKQRIAYPTHMEDDHSEILNHIHTLVKLVREYKWEVGGTLGLQHIMIAFEEYRDTLLPHLLEEERVGLLLMRAYFTPEEIRPVTAQILAKTIELEPFTVGFMCHYLGESYVRHTMMKNEGIPFYVWYLVFKKQMKKFQRLIVVHYEAFEKDIPSRMNQQKRIHKVLKETLITV